MGHETEDVDLKPLVLKRLIWDIFPHDIDLVRDAQSALGLVPDGDDGMEIEHSASDTRLNRVSPLSDVLGTLSEFTAEIMSLYMAVHLQEEDEDIEIPEGFLEGFAQQNTTIISEAVYAILAHLLDTGVLEYGKKVRKPKDDA